MKSKIIKADYLLYWILLGVFILFTAIASISIVRFYNSNVAPDATDLGLPSYVGPCAGLVRMTHDALRANHDLYLTVGDVDEKKRLYKVNVIKPIANAFTYSSFCTDPEAVGLMLTADANITLDSAFNGIVPFNEAVPLARSYYNEAASFGYWNNHHVQQYLLHERIVRNEFRLTIKAPF